MGDGQKQNQYGCVNDEEEEERRIFIVFYFQTDRVTVWITDIVWKGDSRLLQESNLTTRQPRRAPHYVIHQILQTPLPSEWRTSKPYGDAEFVNSIHQHQSTTYLPLIYGPPLIK